MLKYLHLFSFLLLLGSCAQTCKSAKSRQLNSSSKAVPEGIELVETSDAEGYIEKYERRKSDYAKHGTYRRLSPRGILLEDAVYVANNLDGVRTLYYENGDTLIVEHYQDGKYEGSFQAFYVNGQLELDGQYVDNTMTGKWRRYYKSGELMEIVTFENNAENGPFVEYYKNGNLKAEGNYLDGDNEHGLLKMYDEGGNLIKKMECDRGICSTIWKEN